MNADGSQQTQLTFGGDQNWGPAWSLDGSKIAFSTTRAGNYDVFVMDADGSDQTALTNGAANESAPNWSPDGARLVYVSGSDIFVMQADGSNKTYLTQNAADNSFPAWSPDGTQVVFQSGREGNPELYVMNADGSGQTRLDGTSAQEAVPDWQPLCDANGCPTPAPPPTPTPCPQGGCPSNPTPTPSPNGAPDFSIRISYNQEAVRCESSGTPTTACEFPIDATFTIDVYLNSLPYGLPAAGYAAFDVRAGYLGVTRLPGDDDPHRWPDCTYDAVYEVPGEAAAGCAIDPQVQAPSHYTGIMLSYDFVCTGSGAVTLGLRDLIDAQTPPRAYYEASEEGVAVSCVEPLPPPGDSDGDLCPDVNEDGPDPAGGGQRDFTNPWDYFNPTGDGRNRVDDVLAVSQHFGLQQGDPGYDAKYDRTYAGPNSWNLAPPDGDIRVADILAEVNQYGHDCA